MEARDYAERLAEFVRMLKESRNAVFFGGAGVSTESGLKDYRSEDGMYNTVREYGVSPETILSHDYLYTHTDVFYRFYAAYFLRGDVRPNKAHTSLADLEKRGILSAVITQNVDGLHTAAGSKNVYELHGTSSRHYCTRCKREYPTRGVKALDGEVPTCGVCGGFVRPDIVMYGEELNDATVDGAIRAISASDLLIVGGTSLAVYPAAGFLRFYRGSRVVLINRGETPYDAKATLLFRESVGTVLEDAVKGLDAAL